jgi:hypothetical protein
MMTLLRFSASVVATIAQFHIMIAHPVLRQKVELAVLGASQRLRASECQKVFTDFEDGSGRPLQATLDALDKTGAEFLTWLRFTEADDRTCNAATHVAAFTQPGSRVVQICAAALLREPSRDTQADEVLVIHELLHAIGLRENPPSAAAISRQVLVRCGRQPSRSAT